jgi:hypothetical protein
VTAAVTEVVSALCLAFKRYNSRSQAAPETKWLLVHAMKQLLLASNSFNTFLQQLQASKTRNLSAELTPASACACLTAAAAASCASSCSHICCCRSYQAAERAALAVYFILAPSPNSSSSSSCHAMHWQVRRVHVHHSQPMNA